MDFDDEPFVVDRTDSFPHDRAYPSRSTRSQIPKRPTKDSLLNDRYLNRRDTGDFEPRKRLRYTIPLRHKSRSLGDVEKGHSEKSPYGRGYSTPLGIDRETSRDPWASPPPQFLEIISTKWVPDDEGREIVTLTIKDQEGNRNQADIPCESRWKHIQNDGMTLGQFYQEVMRTPGLGDDDLALVGRLLNKVRNTSEKKFVHGRYLKPITLVYEGEDTDSSASYPSEERRVPKIATFVSLPVFTISCPKRHDSTKDFEGHPVRALLQSRYRLESTKRRDKEQVITKTTSIREQLAHESHVVHVPQIWALMINNNTIITCAALDASVLRGETIKLMSYTAAQLDEATWSIHFTDARGKDFYLPLRFCKTWFDLVRQITDHCLHDEYSFIRDQLLKGGSVYQLVVVSDGSVVDADKWSKLVEETKTEVIHLKLVDNESVSIRYLVTYCDDEGNDISIGSDDNGSTSPIFSSDDDGEDSDSSETSMSSGMSSSDMSRAIDRLRNLQTKLREAETKGHAKKAEELKDHKIPVLEGKLLGLAAAGLDLETSIDEETRKRSRIIIPAQHDRRPRPSHEIDHDSPMSPTERYRTRLRSRSRSTSRSRLVQGGNAFSHSAYDLSLKESSARGRTSQPWAAHDRKVSTSPSRYFRDVEYNRVSRARPHIRSLMSSVHSLPRISTLPSHSRSRWDLLRSRVRDRQLPGLRSYPVSPMTRSSDIYYQPSEKQLARSYWDLVRSSVLEGGIQKLRDAEDAKKGENVIDRAKNGAATASDKQRIGLSGPRRLSDVPDVSPIDASTTSPTTVDPPATSPPEKLHVPAESIPGVSEGKNDQTKPKKIMFSKDSLENKPKLRRLIKLAQKESTVPPSVATSPAALETSSPVSSHPTTDIPIFLWSTEHKQSENGNLAHKIPPLPAVSEAPASKSSRRKPAEALKQVIPTSKTEELILHAVLAEVHVALKKPKRGTPEFAAIYEKTGEKTYADVVSSVNAIKNTRIGINDRPTAEEGNVNNRISYSRRASLAFAGVARRQSASTRSLSNLSGHDDPTLVKVEIFDLARTVLLAFVPKEKEAPVISKYWGALHGLLTKASSFDVFMRVGTDRA